MNVGEIDFAVAEASRCGLMTVRRAFGRVASIQAREEFPGRLANGIGASGIPTLCIGRAMPPMR